MTTPPQGPWGPGQQGDRPEQQGGWGRQQGPQQPGWGQPGGWGQQPGHGQPGDQQSGHGQQPGPGQQSGQGQGTDYGSGYTQQPWGSTTGQQGHQQQGGWTQQPGQGGWQAGQGGWQQGQGGWQQGQGGWQTPQQPWQGGGGRNKPNLPLFIGGGVVALVLVGLLIFFGIRLLGGDDDKADPTPTSSSSTAPTDGPTPTPGGDNGLGNATGQAKNATDKLTAAGFQCSDLFNRADGAHRGCFKYDGSTEAEAVFQFTADGSLIGFHLRSYDSDNVNKAAETFETVLAAVGGEALGGDLEKIRAAVKSGQKDSEVATGWGEVDISNDGDSLRARAGKSGTDSLPVPRKQFEVNDAAFKAGLQGKGYKCTAYTCSKEVGSYGSQRVSGFSSGNEGLRSVTVSASGDTAQAKSAFGSAQADAFAVVKGADVGAIQAWAKAHNDGKTHIGYVNGWRVELSVRGSDSFSSLTLEIQNEFYYI